MKKQPQVDESGPSAKTMWMLASILAIVGAVGLFTVWENTPSGAIVLVQNTANEARWLQPVNSAQKFCQTQADCGVGEVCAGAKVPNNWMYTCQPSHQCARDQDCWGLGYSPSLMQCVDNWCRAKNY